MERLREVFAEVRRVLAGDGTLWLNIGDSLQRRGQPVPGRGAGPGDRDGWPVPGCTRTGAIRPGAAAKNMLGMPWRLAFALQDDGWILRNDIVWHKPNAMPETVADRLNTR